MKRTTDDSIINNWIILKYHLCRMTSLILKYRDQAQMSEIEEAFELDQIAENIYR